MLSRKIFSVILVATAFAACTSTTEYSHDDNTSTFTRESLEEHIKILASDEFEGRKPFTEGEKKTLKYLEEQFKKLGLEPGNGGSYLQEVPMVEITAQNEGTIKAKGPKRSYDLKGFDEYILNTERTDSSMTWKDVDVVFAGFGIVAPEYNWNDYEGLDVKGKIVLVLVNDPGFGSNDTTFFKGNTMTYYGRWTYKYEEAARQGAKGCFVIHNTVPAGYPFAVLQNGWNNAHLYLDQRGQQVNYCEGIGWLTKDATETIFSESGKDFNAEQTKARQPGFKGYALDTKFSTSLKVETRYDKSHNVIAKLTGSRRPDEYVIYTAHWDHLGIGKPDASGDSIYNGALDNASGTAGLLEIAKAFSQLKEKPERTVVFLAVTAEEQGLWGSAYYAINPVYAKEKTVANINMDGVNPYGRTKDVMIIGVGQSELEDDLKEIAKKLNRDVYPDDAGEKGSYFRSDHFSFAKIGIPALYIKAGNDLEGKGIEAGKQLRDTYTQKYYHQPSDQYDTTRMNYSGGVEDLKLLYLVGKKIANEERWPKWKEGSEFKAIREAYKK